MGNTRKTPAKKGRLDIKRDCRFQVRLPQKELDILNRKARTARITTSAFVRRVISGTEVYEAPTVDVVLLLGELRRVGYNVNRILRRSNACGIVDIPQFRKDMEEVRRAADTITEAYGVDSSRKERKKLNS